MQYFEADFPCKVRLCMESHPQNHTFRHNPGKLSPMHYYVSFFGVISMLPSVNGAFPSPIYLFLSSAKSGKQKKRICIQHNTDTKNNF